MIKSNPLISVIMPAYNSERYIKKAVESVLFQTYTNWELLIIDDASSDGTYKILSEISDDRIRIFRNETNQGVAYSRNLGAKKASGEWLAFLDSDDMWEFDKLELQLIFATERNEGKLFFTGSAFMNETGEQINYILHVPTKISMNEILKQNLISCSSVIVDKETFLNNPMPECPGMHEDFASWISILKHEKYAYGLDRPLLIYRIQSDSKSGDKVSAARMQWRTYRKAGINTFRSISNMFYYSINGITKHKSSAKAGTIK